MSALAAQSPYASAGVDEDDLSVLNSLDLDLLLLTRAKRQGGQVFEFELGHDAAGDREVSDLWLWE